MLGENAVLFARGASGRAADVPRLDLTFPKKSIASRAFLDGPAHTFDLFGGIGFLSVGGRVRFVVGKTLFPEEEPMTTAAGVVERLPRFEGRRDISCLCRGGDYNRRGQSRSRTQHKIDSYPGNLGESYTRG